MNIFLVVPGKCFHNARVKLLHTNKIISPMIFAGIRKPTLKTKLMFGLLGARLKIILISETAHDKTIIESAIIVQMNNRLSFFLYAAAK